MRNMAVNTVAFGLILLGATTSPAQDFVFEAHPSNSNFLEVETYLFTRLFPAPFYADYDDSGEQNVEAAASLNSSDSSGQWQHGALVGINPYGQSLMSLSGIAQQLFMSDTTLSGSTGMFTDFRDVGGNDRCRYWSVIDSIYPEETPCTLSGYIAVSWNNLLGGGTTPYAAFDIYVDNQQVVTLWVNNGQSFTDVYPFSMPPPSPAGIDPDSDFVQIPFIVAAEVGSTVEVAFRARLGCGGQPAKMWKP